MKLTSYEIKLIFNVLKDPEQFKARLGINGEPTKFGWGFGDSTEQETFDNLIEEFNKEFEN